MPTEAVKRAIQLRREVQAAYGVDAEDLRGKSRDPAVIAAKAAYLARGRALKLTVVAMGDALGITACAVTHRSFPEMQRRQTLRKRRLRALAKIPMVIVYWHTPAWGDYWRPIP